MVELAWLLSLGCPPLCGALLDGEMCRETREGGLNDRVAVLRGLVMVIERAIESLTPGGLVESRVLSGATNSPPGLWFPLDR